MRTENSNSIDHTLQTLRVVFINALTDSHNIMHYHLSYAINCKSFKLYVYPHISTSALASRNACVYCQPKYVVIDGVTNNYI
jgi:hypothetical protein